MATSSDNPSPVHRTALDAVFAAALRPHGAAAPSSAMAAAPSKLRRGSNVDVQMLPLPNLFQKTPPENELQSHSAGDAVFRDF